MNYKIIQTLITLVCISSLQSISAHSHSFFMPRSITTDSAFELSLANYHRYHSEPESTFQLYVRPFAMQSTNGKKLARYFLPNNNSCVTVNENGLGNIDPLWFNLIGPADTFYSSLITIDPKRTVFGALFTFYAFYDCWWVGLHTTLMHAKTNLHLLETGQSVMGTLPGFANAYQAFNNPAWTAGKIPCGSEKRTGLDDIQYKIGYDFVRTDDNHATLYAVGTIPTGKRPTSATLFEPLVGSKHASFGVGFNGDYRVYECNDHRLNVMLDLKYRYVFAANERRSFDLAKNGDWSRYLLVFNENAPLIVQPGINLLTLSSKVEPRSTIDLWTAIHYQICDYNIELGYDFWWRQAEKVSPKCCIAPSFGIQTLSLCSAITTASTATICQAASGSNATVTDDSFIAITNADLDLCSAAHPSAHSSTVYAHIARTYNQESCRSWLLGLGTSYEIGNRNALSQWAVWLTGGIGF